MYHSHSPKPVFELIIGDKSFSSWSMRAWLVAVQSGLPFREKKVLLDRPGTAAKLKKLSPSGKVPALRHGKTLIWDSLAIAEYLHELSPEAHLWPQEPEVRAEARSYAAEMHSSFAGLRAQLSMDLHVKMTMRHLEKGTLQDIERVQELWTQALNKSEGPFLFGNFSIADAFFAPVVFRFLCYGVKISDKGLRVYMENIQAHPAVAFWVKEALSES